MGWRLSSRNRYLSAEERARAPAIYQALQAGGAARSTPASATTLRIERDGAAALERAGMSVDYFAIRNAADLSAPTAASSELVVLTAARAWAARA